MFSSMIDLLQGKAFIVQPQLENDVHTPLKFFPVLSSTTSKYLWKSATYDAVKFTL